MLINCPECDHQVSDRAPTCPSCGFPIAEDAAAKAAEEAAIKARATREHAGEVDCPPCEARGFVMEEMTNSEGEVRQGFRWCKSCKHSGRICLVKSDAGYHAVTEHALDDFLAGSFDADATRAWELGTEEPDSHRYPEAGAKKDS